MSWRRNIIEKVKEYIDTNLYLAKTNIIDPQKENYQLPPTKDCILSDLTITCKDYYDAVSVSKDSDYERHLIRVPNSCFVNNYFEEGLMAWQANMDIQPVFNEYKAVTYMCSYFSKSEDQCSASIRQAAKEDFQNNESLYDTMKTIVRAYTSKRECFVQEAVYHIFPELHLRRVFPEVYFVNTNMPEDRSRILLSEEEIEKLPDKDIFKRNNINWYIN